MSRHHKRLSNARWERTRQAVFRRDNQRCLECGKPGFEVHHLIPLDENGAEYDMDNLACYCRTHHIDLHRKPLPPERAEWAALVQELANS